MCSARSFNSSIGEVCEPSSMTMISRSSLFKDRADFCFNSSFPYELPVLNATATKLFKTIPEGIERFEELRQVFPALLLFGDIDEKLVADDALIREFIGGGIYEY